MSQPVAAPSSAERLVAGRPRHFPSVYAWLSVGIWRNWRGLAAALIGTWFYLPFAIFTSVVGAVLLGILGFLGDLLAGVLDQAPVFSDLPLLRSADDFLPTSGGVVGGLVGVLLGLVLGFVGGLGVFWVLVSGGDPAAGLGWLVGVTVTGLLVGFAYTLWRVVFETVILRMSGARRLSRREARLLLPVMAYAARRLGLSNFPPVMIDDSDEPHVTAYTRHIVISRGLLEQFRYDRDVVAAVMCHELVHWRNGDAISAVFVRGVALPLYAVYAIVGWLTSRRPRSLAHAVLYALLALIGWLLFWPVIVTVRFFVMPLQAADVRQAEYRADQGAVLAGHRDGLRRVLTALPHDFEIGRNGWTAAVTAAHPPHELRLERLEDPDRSYPLPDPGSPGSTTP